MLLLLALLLLLAGPVWSETRAAFIVGNSSYANATALKNPANDARLIADTLASLDFSVTSHFDLDRRSLTQALGTFLQDNSKADVTLFYFAGHGMQFEGRNYLLPTDALLQSEFDVEAETVALDRVIKMIETRSRSALIFIDACRDNPLATEFYTSNYSSTRATMSRGLAKVNTTSQGSMVVFSAAPGQVALDGSGDNSPFAASLARHLPSENVEVLSLMKRIIRDVKTESDEAQVPVVQNDLTTEIYLNLGTGGAGAALALQQEEAVFDAALAIGSRRAWEIYLRRYPSGNFTELALAEMDRLTTSDLAALSGTTVTPGKPLKVSRDVAAAFEATLGLSKADNVAVQTALNARGYNVGAADGAIGPKTRRAIADFQAAQSLPVTGVITKATAAALGVSLASFEASQTALISSTNARRYDPDQLALVEDDARLIKAARALEGIEFTYGFFEDRLYIGALTWGGRRWDTLLDLVTSTGGYPIAVNSKGENDFILELVRDDERFWKIAGVGFVHLFGPAIGLVQIPGAREPDGGWEWFTKEPVTYKKWWQGQPGNEGGNEGFTWIASKPVREGSKARLKPDNYWVDVDAPGHAIIIEIE